MALRGDAIIMLGDSLTAQNDWGRPFPALNIKNLGINGDTCPGVRARLSEVTALRPAVIFLQIGINDFLRGAPPEDLVASHLRIWEELAADRPPVKLWILSLTPYLEAALPGLAPNLDILYINHRLAEEAEKRGLGFINLFSALADENHQLRLEYTSDGVHLTPEGYRVWESLLKPAPPLS